MESVTEPALSPCRDSLFLLKLQVSTIIDRDGVYDGVCFDLHPVAVCF